MRRALIGLALVACSARRADPPPAVAAIRDAGSAPAIRPPEPEPFPPPDEVACTFDASGQGAALAIGPDGGRFAWISDVHGTLTVPVGTPERGARVEHDSEAVRLRGFVDEVVLFAKVPVVLAGAFVPHPGTRLSWKAGEPGAIVVDRPAELTDKRSTKVVFAERPSARIGCRDLGLRDEDGAFDALKWALRGLATKEAYVATARAIPLARGPGETPIATIEVTYPEEGHVYVVEKRGGSARVVIDRWYGGVLFGWIPDDVLVAPPTRVVGGMTANAPRVRMGQPRREPTWRDLTCPEDVALVAEVGARRVRVGEVKARTPFRIAAGEDEWREARVPGVEVSDDARLLARGCDANGG